MSDSPQRALNSNRDLATLFCVKEEILTFCTGPYTWCNLFDGQNAAGPAPGSVRRFSRGGGLVAKPPKPLARPVDQDVRIAASSSLRKPSALRLTLFRVQTPYFFQDSASTSSLPVSFFRENCLQLYM